MASQEINSSDGTLCSNELATWWEHYDLMVQSIKDPDALAEAACKVSLIDTGIKDMIVAFRDVEVKTRSLLQIIEGKVKGHSIHFHLFLTALRSLPGLTRLISRLQASYDGRVMGILVVNNQQTDDCEDDESNMSIVEQDEYSDDDDDASVDTHAPNERTEQEHESQDGGIDDVNLDKIDSTVLGLEDEQAVREVLMTLAARYNCIGIALGLSSGELESIRCGCFGDPKLALGVVINTWLKQTYNVAKFGLPSWKSLVKAVDSPAGGCNHALAKRIASKHEVKKRNHGGADEPRTKIPRIDDVPLMRFRPKLADFYSKKPEVPESAWPPIKKTHYINLALIKPQAMNFGKDYVRQTVRGSIDDIFKDKEEIKYEDAFNKHDERSQKMILLEGRPGCGKTTLMHKISQDWEKGEILSSYLLFLVHLRRFNNKSDIQLSDILCAATLNFTRDDIEEMCKLIERSSGQGVVFALDGLDEYSPKSEESENFVYNLIEGKQLTNAVVIVASRPAATQPFRSCASKHVEILGFLEPQIHEYINDYFRICGCPEKAQGLLDYLKLHLNIMHMCYLPLHVAMVTHLYEIEGTNLPQTESEIYRHFTLSTLIRSSRKRCLDSRPSQPFNMCNFDQLSPEDKAIFDIVLTLAFNSTVVSQQVFSLEDIRKYIPEKSPSCGDDESTLGLIVVDRYFVKYGLDEIYSFIHLTLQEYLSSLYIANQTDEEQKRIISSHGSDRRLAEVWKFYCGIGKCSHENFELLLTNIQTSVKKYQTQSMLLQLRCCYESQQEWTCTQVVNTHESCIKLSKGSLTPSDMTALGYVMSHSETPLEKLVISSCYVGPEGLVALTMELKETAVLKVLSFKGTKIKSEMVDSFAHLLKIFSSLQELNLSSCVSKSTLNGITQKIPTLPSIKMLDISCNQLGSSSSTAKAFLDKLLNLQTLKVHLYKDCKWYVSMNKNNQLRNIDVETIIPRCSNVTEEAELDLATCKELFLMNMKISAKEGQIIGERLKECPNLSQLYLGDNQIKDTGAHAIAEGCKFCPNLQTIYLGGNQIKDTGAQAIAEGCKFCPNLQSIDLRYNSITDAGIPHLVGLMETAKKLETFYIIDNNKFTEAGKSQLRQAAEKRNSDPTNYARLSLDIW